MPGTFVSYTLGFIVSIILTLMAYAIVVGKLLPDYAAFILILLAAIQMVIQLVFFLHIGSEDKPKWNLAAMLFMMVMIGIIVVGSLWIMSNLNYNMMMSPEDMNKYMFEQAKKGF